MRLGILSDTHGLLRPEAEAALRGCDHILHAGDIGDPAILTRLAAIAPVTAIRGNVDRAAWTMTLPERVTLTLGGLCIHMLHDVKTLEPGAWDLVIFGHSHVPLVRRQDGALHLNPGSCGPRRFRLPVTLVTLIPGEEPQIHRLLD